MVDPLKQFMIKPLIDISVCGVDLSFTNSSMAVFLCILMLSIFFIGGSCKQELVPSRWQAATELCFNLVAGMFDSNDGDRGRKYFFFVFTVFFFVL